MRALASFLLLSIIGLSTPAAAAVIDYTAQPGGNVASPYALGGVTASSAGQLTLTTCGLGVQGGNPIFLCAIIDAAESVTFSFDAGATGVSVSFPAQFVGTGDVLIEGFGVGGASLGSATLNSVGGFDVSGAFGNAPLSAFSITGGGGTSGVVVGRITFAPIPEPATIVLMALGLAGLLLQQRRQR